MRRHEHVVRDVDQELLLLEDLDLVARGHLRQALPREGRQRGPCDDDGAAHAFAAHALGVDLDDFDALFFIVIVVFEEEEGRRGGGEGGGGEGRGFEGGGGGKE